MKARIATLGAALAATGLAASGLILPSASEQALMLFKDKEFSLSRVLFERRLEGGEDTVAVVMPLIQLYLQVGEPERAIDLAERFVARHPRDAEAHRMLAGLHKANEMPSSYVADLEAIAALRPDPATLRELADSYLFQGRADDRIAVLARLAQGRAATAADLVELAEAQAAAGRTDDALATMERHHGRFADHDDARSMLLHVGLLVRAGRGDAAQARATAWAAERPEPATAVAVAALLTQGGLVSAVPALLAPFAESGDAEALEALVAAERATGQAERALDRLAALREDGRLPAAALPLLVDLALSLDRAGAAFDALTPQTVDALPNDMILAVAEAAVAAHRDGVVDTALAHLADSLGGREPVLLGSLALLMDDRDQAARWAAQAEATALPIPENGRLVTLLIRLGRARDALARLDGLVRSRAVDAEALPAIAAALAGEGLAAGALPVMVAARGALPSLDSDRAWAVVALRLGQVKEVTAWLNEAEKRTTGSLPEELYTSARDARVYDFALLLAERLEARAPSLGNRLNLAEALALNNRWREAEPILRTARDEAGLDTARYVEALTFAFHAGAPVAEELRGYWRERYAAAGDREHAFYALLDLADYEPILAELAGRARAEPQEWLETYALAGNATGRRAQVVAMLESDLARPNLDEAATDERLTILAQLAGDAATLPHLRRLADRLDGDWVFAYAETLERLGRRGELIAYYEERAGNPALPTEQRRDIVSDLLEMGGRDAAERALRKLADAAGPTDEAVEDLLFLWGPRPDGERVAWLHGRVRSAPPAERPAWLRLMLAAELPAVAADSVPARDLPDAAPELVQTWVEAVAALPDPAAAGARLKAALAADRNGDHMALYGAAAADAEQWAVAQTAYAELARQRPDDTAVQRRLAEAALAADSLAAARDALARVVALAPDDSRSALELGDVLLRLDGSAARDGEARALWQAGLAALDRRPAGTDFDEKRLRADLLHRLRRSAEAAELYTALLAQRPDDTDLKADLASTLIDARKFDTAGKVLGTAAPQ